MAPSTVPLCLYHRNCLDGRSATAVVRRAWPDAECRPCQPGWELPGVRGRRVAVVDLGFPLATMRRLLQEADELVWCDHHASWEAVHRALGHGSFDLEECGATLTWRHFFPQREPPPVLAHVRDRDLWHNRVAESTAVCAGLMHHFDDATLDGILDADPRQMAATGHILLTDQERRIARAISSGIPSSDPYGLLGRRALVLNQGDLVSQIGERVCAPPDQGGHGYDLCICYQADRQGRWLHSLRSAGLVDCARIAVNRGGGGHERAAAYPADLPFLQSEDCLDLP